MRLLVMKKIVDHRSLATEIINVLAAGINKERVTFHAHTSKLEGEVEPVQFAKVEIFELLDDCVKSRNGGIPEQGVMNGGCPAIQDTLGLILDNSPIKIKEESETHVLGWGDLIVLGNVAALEQNGKCQSDMVKKVTVGVYKKLLHEHLNKGVTKGSCIVRNFPGAEIILKNVVVFREAKLSQPCDNRAGVFAILMNCKEQSHVIRDIKSKLGTKGMIS